MEFSAPDTIRWAVQRYTDHSELHELLAKSGEWTVGHLADDVVQAAETGAECAQHLLVQNADRLAMLLWEEKLEETQHSWELDEERFRDQAWAILRMLGVTAHRPNRLQRVLIATYQQYWRRRHDEVLNEVSQRVQQREYLTKADIGALAFWMHADTGSGWVPELHRYPDAYVQEVTSRAFVAVQDGDIPAAGQRGCEILRELSDLAPTEEARFSLPLASAILLACAPHRMAIWNSRVEAALDSPETGPGIQSPFGRDDQYAKYLEICEYVAAQLTQTSYARLHRKLFTPRDADTALSQLGRQMFGEGTAQP